MKASLMDAIVVLVLTIAVKNIRLNSCISGQKITMKKNPAQ